ncbi:methyl-accepting chemotaxis protein [Telluria beijingensis]|uniref:methyl-accepting chemotaxis protein n=1 Tax=Telluria beijingensis TaxID=3068633 RepID=UPI002795F168|nr:methyl-accepting chemotaxis protein [Massilia sp. REN29]
MFVNLTIGARLAIGFAIVTALLAGIVLVALQSLASLHRSTAQIVDDRYPQVVLATELLLQLDANAIAMRNMLLADDPNLLRAETAALREGERRIAAGLKTLEGMLSSEMGRKSFQEIMALRATYQQGQARFLALAAGGGTFEASALLMTTLRQDQQAYSARLRGFLAGGGKLMEQSGQDAAALYREKRLHIVLLACAAGVLAIVAGIWITRSITRPLQDAVRVARTVAGGDLGSDIVVRSRDEVGQLMAALKDMNGRLRQIVSEVRGGTDAIADAAKEMAQGNMDLSGRTEQQAGALEETASTMEELGATVERNAAHAGAARERARDARRIAVDSHAVVGQVVETMQAIEDSSRRITEITGVIDGIAFQTNILALNAAVEAARAGAEGRGFAVVAAEVRNLAQRAGTAAQDIKRLIDTSRANVENGGRLAAQAGATMQGLVDGIAGVAETMGEIAHASAEQSSGLGQVNAAVLQMDAATQQNAALVEQAAAASQALQERAARLAALVGTFRLGRDTVAPSMLAGQEGGYRLAHQPGGVSAAA